MTTIYLQGGLGNQLFQMAAAYAHCQRTRTPLYMKCLSAAHGTYWDTYLRLFSQGVHTGPVWKEPHFHYTPIPTSARELKGYFQSSRHFAEYASEIKVYFTPGDKVSKYVTEKYGHLIGGLYAVIHIRRGDYFRTPASQTFHGVLTKDYYRRAVAQMRSFNPALKFLVFSDDLPWCRRLDFLEGATFVEEADASSALHLMSQFRYYILSNSTFSWWGAWLGEKAEYVIAPDRWFGSAGPSDYQDVYEPTWDRLPVVSDRLPVVSDRLPVVSDQLSVVSDQLPVVSVTVRSP